jgi:CHAT domain-containing protein/Flp pilus assembly protein TadD/predicted negative regulator of RcsB-dependent stress response
VNYSLKIRSGWLLVLCLLSFRESISQTASGSTSPNDQYRQIVRGMAQPNYERVIVECKALIELSPGYTNAYATLAEASAEAGQLDQTRAWFESLLLQTPPQPMAYVGLAFICEAARDYAGAVDNYQKYLRQMPDADHIAMRMAIDYFLLKKTSEGEVYFKSLIAASADSSSGRHGLGWLYALQGRRAEALTELNQLATQQPGSTLAHLDKALTLISDGRYQAAIDSLDTCLTLLETNADDELEKIVLGQRGVLHKHLGNYSDALKDLEKLLAMSRDSNDMRNEEVALSQMGSAYYQQSDYVRTEEYWRRALELSKTIVVRRTRLKSYPQNHLGNLGDVYYKLGDLAAAKRAYNESLVLSREVNDEANESSVLTSLGDLYVAEPDLKQALVTYEQALALGEKRKDRGNQIGALLGLSALHRERGNQQPAMDYVQRVLRMLEGRSDSRWQGEALTCLGLLHLRFGEIPEAMAAFQKTLAIDPNTTSPHVLWEAHSGLAVAYVRSKQLDRALEHYQRAIEAIERVRAGLGGDDDKAGFFQDKVEVYKRQIALLMDLNDGEQKKSYSAEAFRYAERGRARGFLDLLAETKVNPEQNAAPALLQQKQKLQERISHLTEQLIKERSQERARQDQARIDKLKNDLDQADSELAEWLRELRRRNPRYAALKYPEPVTLAETQRILDDKTILLSYSLAEPESFLFAVTHDGFQAKRLPSGKQLGARVQKLLAAIADKNNPNAEEYRHQAARLSLQLLQPVSKMLAGKRALVIVADGALHRLPFEVLFLPGQTAQGDLRGWPFLIRRFAISYVPSASVLSELQSERATAAKGFIAFGDPVYDQSTQGDKASALRALVGGGQLNLQRLPYSHVEIEGIAQLFAKDELALFFGDAATEENVKTPERLSHYRMVHFSTHGYLNETRPRFSGLVLSLPATAPQSANAPQSEDGVLSAYEIFNLKLKADLVVLSACETGLGKEVKGEGLMSLTRAFMYAGTPSVVVSLWNLNDETSRKGSLIRKQRFLKCRHAGMRAVPGSSVHRHR